MTQPTQDTPPNAGAYGLLALLRRLEREAKGKPRIGRNHRLKDEIAALGQDPSLSFPGSDFSSVSIDAKGKADLRSNFLGFFGPQGALPLNTTEEVARWVDSGDESFVKFTDIFTARFLQLFFRAWSDSHAISQFDVPEEDRFQTYIGALGGVGTPAFRKRDRVEDVTRMPMVSLVAARVKSAVRLRQMIEHHLGAEVTVEEHVPGWLDFEENDQSKLGQQGSSLGRNTYLGARLQSVGEKVCLHIRTTTLEEYRSYLPGGTAHAQLCDLVFWYLGKSIDVAVNLSLPSSEVAPAKLGETTELGWMAALTPKTDAGGFVSAATFTLDTAANTAAA